MRMTKKSRNSLKRNTKIHKAYLSDTSSVSSKTAYSNICKTVQTKLRDMQDSWVSKKADEIQSFADRKDMKKHLRQYMVPRAQELLLSADGTSLLTDKEAILKRWAELFDGVLNRPSSISDAAIIRLPQVECNPLLNEFPTVSETVKEITLLSSGKAPESMQYLQRSTKQEVLQLQRNWHISHYVEKRSHSSRIQGCNNYPPIQRKEVLKSVTITEASLYCQSLGRSSQESYWIVWMNILTSQGFYPKASVDSGKTEELQTWSSQLDSFKRNARNRMWTSTWPLSTLPKHLTKSVVRDFGKLWQSLAVLPNV